MNLHHNINEFFSNSISNITQKMTTILRDQVDLSQIIQHKNIAYGDHASHTCDIWHLKERDLPQPTVLYIHGGGFRRLNKDIMWPMAYKYACLGFTVCSINYRLAPEHPCPSALIDVQKAYLWWLDNSPRFGGDSSQTFLSGESAGANLACGIALASCRPFSLLESTFYRGKRPRAVIAICPFIEVEVHKRLERHKDKDYPLKGNLFFEQFLHSIERQYQPKEHSLGNLLSSLQSSTPMFHNMPTFYVIGGMKDPVFLDAVDLHQTLLKLQVQSHFSQYTAGHNFQTYLWNNQSKQFWEDIKGNLYEFSSKYRTSKKS